MVNKKKQVPLAIWEILEPYITKTSNLIRLANVENEQLVKFVDKDPNSDFYFIIEKSNFEAGKLKVLITYKPRHKSTVNKHTQWTLASNFEKVFKEWLSYLEGYSNTKTPFDDPILQQYENEFFADFEIIDDDAEFKSFNLDQQLFLDEYLNKVIKILESHSDDTNKEQIESVNEDISDLRKKLTISSKKQTIEYLARIWAKIHKIGIPIIKEVYVQARNELIKQFIQGQIGQ